MIAKDAQASYASLAIVERYEAVIDYLYPILQNTPRKHGVLGRQPQPAGQPEARKDDDMIINTRSDLEAMRGTPDYAAALTAILGATTTWVNHGTPEAPDWRQETALSHIERLAFPSPEAFLAECAAHGIAPSEPQPPVSDPVPEPAPPTEADYAAAIQAHIDATARSRGYNNGVAAASYGSSTVPAWAAEAAAFVAWRDAVWVYAYQQLAAVEAEQRAQPTPAELVAELPAIVWPE